LDEDPVVHPTGVPPYQPPPVTERPLRLVNEPFVTLSVPARAEAGKKATTEHSKTKDKRWREFFIEGSKKRK